MINNTFLDDRKIKDIFIFIKGMRHSEQIRMMFFCSLNGMRSINFRLLQIKDVFTPDMKVRDMICLDGNKNKGLFGCTYYLNSQIKREFSEYLKYLQGKNNELTPETYLFTSQKLGKPYNRITITKIFRHIYKQFNIDGASHLGRHLFVSKLINSGINICLVQKLVNHRNVNTTQKYFIYNPQMLANAVESVRI